jgi:hypothetical protein
MPLTPPSFYVGPPTRRVTDIAVDLSSVRVTPAADHWPLAVSGAQAEGAVIAESLAATRAERAAARDLYQGILSVWGRPLWWSKLDLDSGCESPNHLLDLATHRRAVAAEKAAFTDLMGLLNVLWAFPEPPKAWSRA